jgi:tripartite-type tricarboxylate transporter receptor subunit TctC
MPRTHFYLTAKLPSINTSVLAACVVAFAADIAQAQSGAPTPIRIIVPFTPGAGTDVVARGLAAKMGTGLQQNVIVDNRPGAGGIVGSELVARSAPDGQTILMGNTSTLAIAPALHARLPYDPVRDFAPISLVTSTENVVVVHPSLPVKSIQEFITLAKTRPGQILFASAGNGTTSHLGGALLQALTGIHVVHVPYKGSPQATSELVSGQTQMSVSSLSTASPLIDAGRLKALATTRLQRSKRYPQLPTVDESGVKGYEVNLWQGFVVPAGTANAIIGRLNDAFVSALRDPAIANAFELRGMSPEGTSPAQFGDYIKREVAKWADVVKRAKAKVE